MSTPSPWAADPGQSPRRLAGPELLGRAVDYTRGSLLLVGGAPPDARTPCERWDLHALLRHMVDSLAAFTEAAEIGYVDLVPVRAGPGAVARPVQDLVEALKHRACALLAAWTHHPGPGPVAVADRELRSDLVAAAGALEIAVHGWDVAQACGADRPLPPGLALELLEVLPLLVDHADRPARFADPVDVPVHARPSTRLLAALGRRS
ncbi:TIGR03086 family protein [Nocardioides panacis]|uniref:TIGR03086 family protein n=1 Tax=Nocardioides panacis TaxID=2849501 RepID=A0A975SXH8_9ACTN|nr:TIGR03086 family metal-binding protein [Nocardioides panacis]QWZ07765.1 TIGR03086 family protein [Nocardioides panacis]